MRFMIIVKATQDSEAGVMPDEKLLAEMAKYHEERNGGIITAFHGHSGSVGILRPVFPLVRSS